MLNWKSRQKAYHLINPIEDMPDNLIKHDVLNISDDKLLDDILMHFSILPNEFRYPSKSYVVAMVYAKLLTKYFGGEFYDYLNDKDLLFNSDPYFVTYENDKKLYDDIISIVGVDFDLSIGTPAHVIPYFEKEFLIKELNEH